jgi:hypothetical protein
MIHLFCRYRRHTNSYYTFQGNKEGERIKKIVQDGGIIPYEMTVTVLTNAMIATPSKVSEIRINIITNIQIISFL